MPPPLTVLSESDETRIARLEAARDDHRDQLKVLVPLVAQYAVLEERLGSLRADLNNGLSAIRDELKDARADQAEEVKELRAEIKELKSDSVSRAKERRGYMAMVAVCALGLFGNFVAGFVKPAPTAPAAQERSK